MTFNPNLIKDENTFRILLTTDNHVGYAEEDPIRGDDSWKSFEEIMSIAEDSDVDMVLQSGDLFHVNKPSKKSMFHVMRILRKYCLGDKPIEFELLSDPSLSLSNKIFTHPNYEDPNINVSIPLFGISGNHDDATGDDLLSPMDVLSISGLLNYFGKVTQNDSLNITPLLFKKGSTKLALYGLSNVRDERLYKTFRDSKVQFSRPNIETNSWFNLMCVHQNHSSHTDTTYLPESFLPNFLDFIVWGHEHQCIPYTTKNLETGFDVLQAGSSVATSLSESELDDKHAFILNVKDREYSLEPVKLKSIRPFVSRDIVLSETGLSASSSNKNIVLNFLIDQVENLINDANEKWRISHNLPELSEIEKDNMTFGKNDIEQEEESDNPNANSNLNLNFPLPLVRLRVEYSGGYEVENPRRFSNRFVGRVANINDVVTFYKKRKQDIELLTSTATASATLSNRKNNDGIDSIHGDESESGSVIDIIESTLNEEDLVLLKKSDMSSVIGSAIDKDNKTVIKEFIDKELTKDLKLLLSLGIEDENKEVENVDVSTLKKGFKQILKELRMKTAYERKLTNTLTKQEINSENDNNDDNSHDEDTNDIRKKGMNVKTTEYIDEVISSGEESDYKPLQVSEEEQDQDDEMIHIEEPQPKTKTTRTARGTNSTSARPTTRGKTRGRGRGRARNTTSMPRSSASGTTSSSIFGGLGRK
ncbi:hypothetical protein BVG19_g5214 [[Candida] boidinii]|nr:hypothetical protein BVG19_g5214 [[Candida] boidinii]OWB52699.1 hypothetical protein B5S27_g4280 [[Candida] boidinii]